MRWSERPAFDAYMACEGSCEGQGLRYFRRRCSSFDRRLLAVVLGSLAFFSLVVAIAFALAGAWMIIPFAGLEIAALSAAAWWAARRSGDFERIALDDGRITVETGHGGRLERHEFHTGWARLVTAADGSMALRSHGREIVIGRYCGEESRKVLARELRDRLAARGF
ncbi:MAG: DUF2244 domain-containing protein [Betaproteobacteria bacterium]|jgi:uncharacterized membrane protein|nr:DUF2244 domain-containing protein [Betaproteobacteria bacterium]